MAEETILLSDFKSTNNPKVITLKKINQIEPKEELEQLELDEQDATLRIEIEKKKEELKSLEEQKNKMLIELKEAILKEKEAWQETKEMERKQAEEVGYKVGYDAGEEKAIQEYNDVIKKVNEIVETATKDYHRTIEKHELAIVQLAITAAKKIINHKISKNEEHFLAIVKKAIKELKDKSTLSIYLHPDNYQFVSKQKEELEQMIEDDEIISLYIDDSLNEGDCVIKHPFGQIEVGIDLQLQQIKDALEEKLMEN